MMKTISHPLHPLAPTKTETTKTTTPTTRKRDHAREWHERKVKDEIKTILHDYRVHTFTEAVAELSLITYTEPHLAGFYWMPGMGAFGVKGISDYICLVAGRFLAIEAKATPADKPTALQALFLRIVRAAGGQSLVIHNANLDELRARLRSLTENNGAD